MLFKNKHTGQVVEFLSQEFERPNEPGENDRVYFKEYTPAEKYCYAYQWTADYEPLGEGGLCPCCGMPILDKGGKS